MTHRICQTSAIATALFLLTGAAPPALAPATPPAIAPTEIVAAAPAEDWVTIAPSEMLVMDLSPDAAGNARRVVIQLIPTFSQGWVGNIRKLAAAHWWDGTSINRVQDNYVVQWGDADAEDKARAKILPGGLLKVAESEYIIPVYQNLRRSILAEDEITLDTSVSEDLRVCMGAASSKPQSCQKIEVGRDGGGDAYAFKTAFQDGWPFATDALMMWPVHCYGMVGVGRDMPPDTGTGAELYTVIGQAPRHLDRNIALVGRVISGIENLSSLPRGTGPLGFYEKPEQRVKIVSIRLATELPETTRPRFQYLSTESASFGKYADARANRRDPFFIRPAGGADICNVPVPIRPVPIRPVPIRKAP